MSAREVIFLGTASQVPTRTRNHNALFLRWGELGILFDPGEGTQRQLVHAGIAATQITHIAITHFHGDHCLGLAAILQRISLDRVAHPIEIIYPASGEQFLHRLRYSAIYHEQSQLVMRPAMRPAMRKEDAPPGPFVVSERDGTRLLACELDHRVDCFGYRLQEPDGHRMLPERLAALGVRGPAIKQLMEEGELVVGGKLVRLSDVSAPRPGQSFALCMDTRPCRGARELAEQADLLCCESTFLSSEAEEAHAYCHMTAEQAGALAAEAQVRCLVLTHFSQRYTSLEGFAAEAGRHHDHVVVATDLLRVPVPPRKDALPSTARA
jgi:ribonuclease Z